MLRSPRGQVVTMFPVPLRTFRCTWSWMSQWRTRWSRPTGRRLADGWATRRASTPRLVCGLPRTSPTSPSKASSSSDAPWTQVSRLYTLLFCIQCPVRCFAVILWPSVSEIQLVLSLSALILQPQPQLLSPLWIIFFLTWFRVKLWWCSTARRRPWPASLRRWSARWWTRSRSGRPTRRECWNLCFRTAGILHSISQEGLKHKWPTCNTGARILSQLS